MRLNLIGGPGTGKSTTAADIFSHAKRAGRSVELANEYVKTWAYQKRQVHEFDQVTLFGKQLNIEYEFLKAGVRNVITDSPLIMCSHYARRISPDSPVPEHLLALSHSFDQSHEATYLVLDRGDKPYDPAGRWQSYEQALELDRELLDLLDSENVAYTVLPFNDRDAILEFALSVMD